MRRRALTAAEATDWAFVAHSVAPLPGRTAPPLPAEPPPAAPTRAAPVPLPKPPSRRPSHPLAIGGTPDGVDRATWRRFQGGKLATTRRLDLHGMTLHRAHAALTHFLRVAHAERARCVEVITGRGAQDGTATIRREFPHWLNQADLRPLVLAASHPHAANTGSVRILLRRAR